MLLNCDLGESYGSWTMGLDAEVMPHIDQANIACGFHGGDPLTIRKTLALAAEHGVNIGAHPAYPDLVGFGRRPMNLSADEIIANLHYQVAALEGMASSQGLVLDYIKPHGALYNDMMAKSEVRAAIMQAVASYHRPLALMLQATPQADEDCCSRPLPIAATTTTANYCREPNRAPSTTGSVCWRRWSSYSAKTQ
jgi:UPF0271 protein